MKAYAVQLTLAERKQLQKLISSGTAPARKLMRARILLKVDAGMSKTEVSRVLDVTNNTVTKVCHGFQSQRLGALERKKPNRIYRTCLDGVAEAHLIALACSAPPAGRAQWTLRLLQAEMVQRTYLETVSHETIRTSLKKKNLSPG